MAAIDGDDHHGGQHEAHQPPGLCRALPGDGQHEGDHQRHQCTRHDAGTQAAGSQHGAAEQQGERNRAQESKLEPHIRQQAARRRLGDEPRQLGAQCRVETMPRDQPQRIIGDDASPGPHGFDQRMQRPVDHLGDGPQRQRNGRCDQHQPGQQDERGHPPGRGPYRGEREHRRAGPQRRHARIGFGEDDRHRDQHHQHEARHQPVLGQQPGHRRRRHEHDHDQAALQQPVVQRRVGAAAHERAQPQNHRQDRPEAEADRQQIEVRHAHPVGQRRNGNQPAEPDPDVPPHARDPRPPFCFCRGHT